jgi:hypothetical protein
MPSPKLARVLSGLALLLAAFLRLWGIGFAPTYPGARPDEETFIPRAFEMFQGSRGAEILRTGWPEGFFRIYHYLMRLQGAVLHVLWGRPVNLACLYALNPGAVELPARLFAAFSDLLTCVVVGAIVRRLAPKDLRHVAMPLGILVYGCNYLAARDAHFGVSDATLVLCFALCLYFALRAALDHPAFLILAGAAAGAGFGVKYAAAPLAAPCLVAALAALFRFRGRARTLLFCILAGGATVAALLVMSPRIAGHFDELVRSLNAHRFRYTSIGRAHIMDPSWVPMPWWKFYLFEDLPGVFGVPGLMVSVTGLLALVILNPIAGSILLSCMLATIATLNGLEMLFVRYAAPLVVPLAVGLGYVLVEIWRLLSELAPRRVGIPAFALLIGLVILSPFATSVQFDALMARPDTRDAASRWLLSQGPEVHAVTEGWYAEIQLLDPLSAQACASEVPPWLQPGVPTMPEAGSRWPAAIAMGDRGLAFIADEAINNCMFHSPGREKADYVAAGRIVLPCGKLGAQEKRPPLDESCFQLVQTFSPGTPACDSKMDIFDLLLAPFTGFAGWQMAGPEMRLYKNLCKQ